MNSLLIPRVAPTANDSRAPHPLLSSGRLLGLAVPAIGGFVIQLPVEDPSTALPRNERFADLADGQSATRVQTRTIAIYDQTAGGVLKTLMSTKRVNDAFVVL